VRADGFKIGLGTLLWLLIVLSAGGFLVDSRDQLKVETNILKLLPKSENNPLLEVAFEQYAAKNMQQLVFLVESTELGDAIAASKELVKALQNSPHIEKLQSQINASKKQSIAEFLFQYRHQLLSHADRDKLVNQAYADFANETLETIYSPLSGGLANLLPQDPFLLSYRFSQSLGKQAQASLSLNDEFLTAKAGNRHYVFVAAALASSPFDQFAQQSLRKLLDLVEKNWKQQKLQSKLLKTGAIFFAAEAYKTAEQEISTIGATSLILVVLLMLITFRSLTPLLLTSLALVSGIVCGLATILLLFSEIHLITLVFGASLIGVAVDYAFHYFVLPKKLQGMSRVAKIFPAISLGLLSSVVGYLSLLTTPFPGLNQMALFCIVGLTVAFITVTLLFPRFNLSVEASKSMLGYCEKLLHTLVKYSPVKIWRALWFLPVVAIFFAASQTVSQDNIRQFQTTSQELVQDEKAIKSVLELEASNQFYLVFSQSHEELLIQMENVQPVLQAYIENGVIDGFENLSRRLPSQSQQRENYQLIAGLYRSQAKHALLDLGIISEQQYQQSIANFESHSGKFLLPKQWLNSELGKSFDSLWLGKVNHVYAAIIPLKGINDLQALSDINQNAIFVDKVTKISEIFTEYRLQTAKLLAIALLLITALLSFRYGLLKSIFIVSAPIFSISITVLTLFMLNINLTLFNTLALFLIIGIGIDYGLFFAESKRLSERTFLAIFLSALTTIFSFGLLALSQTVAIQSFGMTMLIGISSSFILSPIIGSMVINDQGLKNAKR
jgi:predicted exporter